MRESISNFFVPSRLSHLCQSQRPSSLPFSQREEHTAAVAVAAAIILHDIQHVKKSFIKLENPITFTLFQAPFPMPVTRLPQCLKDGKKSSNYSNATKWYTYMVVMAKKMGQPQLATKV